jgi:hypothetical protein
MRGSKRLAYISGGKGLSILRVLTVFLNLLFMRNVDVEIYFAIY